MDTEYTMWQMVNLCVAPKAVYKQTSFRKQTKNQWARDDPAFVVILAALVALSAVAYCLAFGRPPLWRWAVGVAWAVFVPPCLLVIFCPSFGRWHVNGSNYM